MRIKETFKQIGVNIANQRAVIKMTQEELADILKITRASMNNIENGRQSLSIDKLIILVYIFECSLNDLVPIGINGEVKESIRSILSERENKIKAKRKQTIRSKIEKLQDELKELS